MASLLVAAKLWFPKRRDYGSRHIIIIALGGD
jgi:hypothetical protein